ncbi:hypothetical protein ElyMa_001256100 [Elysia marginata]|uniref:Uncharacterized protein n=1 Tax=Elysia marginata TaxID=1093978 RepID=A0AAV4ICB5_9GAST|nr:hypothetical protein ElyMa_001256100 [Elysia marginata]
MAVLSVRAVVLYLFLLLKTVLGDTSTLPPVLQDQDNTAVFKDLNKIKAILGSNFQILLDGNGQAIGFGPEDPYIFPSQVPPSLFNPFSGLGNQNNSDGKNLFDKTNFFKVVIQKPALGKDDMSVCCST